MKGRYSIRAEELMELVVSQIDANKLPRSPLTWGAYEWLIAYRQFKRHAHAPSS